ncbi:LysM peptidoglycan-binding domain-containing protein [Acanthopleuribacter pedis]|uniref:LysM peptidoglycan-binding domain-containing protein n=1 Tax=Acanthopleuribacter pedis TaxID=442870 RepID=A0A8J7QKA4_9BACT|nr:LysM peptidoglycan-binding domain-containing protein [Acanthopleuribacter pedis]MBO1321530.1 LysM peptidoglycan-binding domain-containing protein [Acanthopleuribacter pedis]
MNLLLIERAPFKAFMSQTRHLRKKAMLAVAFCLVASSFHCRKKEITAPPAAPVVEKPAINYEMETAIAAIEASHLFYRMGLETLAEGDGNQARDYFDRALWELIDCRPEDAAARDMLAAEGRIMVAQIHRAEREATTSAPLLPAADPSALTSLLDDALLELELREIDAGESLVTGRNNTAIDYDMPIISNRVVESFIRAFSTDKAHIIGAALERSTRYLPMMRQIFAEEGLPLDLCYLPLIESAYKNQARSHASAVGLWQFIASTGRIYKLRVNWWLDERMEPEAATRSAAHMLKELYEEFDDWYLALCAYNAGPGRVRRAIRRGGTRDFWQLARRRLLPRETIGYVPAFIAGVTIAKNPQKYGYAGIDYQEPVALTAIEVNEGFEVKALAKHMQLPAEELLAYNQHFIRGVTPDGTRSRLYVPAARYAQAKAAIQTLPEAERMSWRRYVLKRGDTLGRLAQQFGTSVKALQTLNNIRNPRALRVGQTLMIPKGSRGFYPLVRKKSGEDARLPVKTMSYEVQKGDTLYLISKRFQTTIPSLTEHNQLDDPFNLVAGTALNVHQGDRWERRRRGTNRSRGYTTYRVKRGDSLSKIASRFGMGWQRLANYNGLKKSSVLQVGRRLRIPSGKTNKAGSSATKQAKVVTYRIRKGDTLSQIAKRYRVSVSQIKKWNKLGSSSRIHAGQTLRLYL